jgi:hypothetical protein
LELQQLGQAGYRWHGNAIFASSLDGNEVTVPEVCNDRDAERRLYHQSKNNEITQAALRVAQNPPFQGKRRRVRLHATASSSA